MNRSLAPSIALEQKINYILPETHHTSSHVPLFLMRNLNSEAVKIDLVFEAGTKLSQKPVAGLTTALLLAGTDTQTMAEINDQIDDFGGYFNSSVSADHAYLSIYGLNESIESIATVIENALFRANFPDIELAQLKEERRQKLKVSLEKVSTLAQRGFQERLFVGTPYGNIHMPEDYTTITRDEVIQFYEAHYRNGLMKINWVGNPNKDQIERIKGIFSRWNFKTHPKESPVFSPELKPLHIEKADAVQTGIRMGKMLFDRSHPDYHKMTVVNTVLGDYFGSRLMSNIREDKGYTYGIGSFLGENQSNGYFVIATEVGNAFLEDTIVQIKHEIERLRMECIPQEELELVKNYLLGQFLRGADGPFSMMDLFSAAETKGLDFSFYEHALHTILAITAEDIQHIAHTHLNTEEMLLVTAG